MPIEAKAVLLNEIERSLGTVVTAADMPRVMERLSDALSHYDVDVVELREGEDDLLDAYLSAMSVQGRSAKTIEHYEYVIRRMMDAVKTPTRSITVYHLRRYLSDEKGRGIADRTLEGHRQVFSAYFNWLQRERLIENNPTANLGAIKYPKKQKEVYAETDIEKLKNHCRSVRDLAILTFLRATGCRISEVTQLNRTDVDLNALECTVLGKGSKERVVYLDPVAGMVLRKYLDTRKDDLPALFIGKGTVRLQPNAIRKMLKKVGAEADVAHVHPHKFRRTTATNLIRHGMPIQEVAAILGHDKLDTTMQYVRMDKTDIKNAYRKYAA